MTDADIEAAAIKSGGRWNGSLWVFEDADLHPFVRTVLAFEREACAALLDAEHEKRKAWGDNYAGVYARMIRERVTTA